MPDLKLCPFCGGSAKISEHENYTPFGTEYAIFAMCCSCGIRTPYFHYVPEQNQRERAEEAVCSKWNKRNKILGD